jgi:hypothetical protein
MPLTYKLNVDLILSVILVILATIAPKAAATKKRALKNVSSRLPKRAKATTAS